ncbi:colicin V synthesis protein [Longimonas halophila]|uniref:Colicin V synthesis protein n=1 Tax=Longimonas halophila TaxID=1469170 RepID=A0A2H3PAN2_9BACT|nr:CvpA family protein [Longimonas halophila]PEN09328.1 colicin V synthesis protein [Longimonas halophila]
MTLIDLGILVVLALALVRGYMVGGIRQITSIIGMVLAFVVAVQYMRPMGVQMEAWGVPPTFAELTAFTTIFLVVYVGVSFVTHLAERLIKALRLGVLDHVLGSVLSAGKVLLVISGVLLLLARAGWPTPDMREASALYEPVRKALPAAWDYTAAYIGNAEQLDHLFPDAYDRTAYPPNDPTAPRIERLLPTDLMRFDTGEASPPAATGKSDAPRSGW